MALIARLRAEWAARAPVRYLCGAGVCALANNIVLVAVDAMGGPLLAGILASWLVGGCIGYAWHARVTWHSAMTRSGLARFLGGALAGVPVAWAVLWLFAGWLRWPMWLAGPAMTLVLFAYHAINAWVAIRWPVLCAVAKGKWRALQDSNLRPPA